MRVNVKVTGAATNSAVMRVLGLARLLCLWGALSAPTFAPGVLADEEHKIEAPMNPPRDTQVDGIESGEMTGDRWDESEWNMETKFRADRGDWGVESQANTYKLEAKMCDAPPEDFVAELLYKVSPWGGSRNGRGPRVLCSIYSFPGNQTELRATWLRAIRKSWASRCNGYVVFGDITSESHSLYGLPKDEGIAQTRSEWRKVQAMLVYIRKFYEGDFDWFLFGGEKLFIVMENLRRYIQSSEISIASEIGAVPIFLGRRLQDDATGQVFNSGDAAFVLNKAAFAVLLDQIMDGCTEGSGAPTDVRISLCLASGGVEPYDTRDSDGQERFIPFHPAAIVPHRAHSKEALIPLRIIDQKEGLACCSTESISINVDTPEDLNRFYHLLYSCPRDHLMAIAG